MTDRCEPRARRFPGGPEVRQAVARDATGRSPRSAVGAAAGLVLALSLLACSPRNPEPEATSQATAPAVSERTDGAEPTATASGAAGSPDAAAPSAQGSGQVLALEGLGDLRIGEPVPAGSGFAARGAQASDSCLILTSPDYPGVYAMVEGGKVRRISAGKRSSVHLAEGIRVGDTEADVKKWFAGFRASRHAYEDPPAKYLDAPNAESGDPALRFEIGHDGRVEMIHVGTWPQLGYVEGCA